MNISSSGKLKKTNYRHAPEVSKQTGFPSAATHYMENPIDLHEELMIHKDATFYIRVASNAWSSFNILKGDVLLIDKSLSPSFDDLILVVKDNDFIIMRMSFDKEQESFVLWGVITYIIHYAR